MAWDKRAIRKAPTRSCVLVEPDKLDKLFLEKVRAITEMEAAGRESR